MSAMGFWDERAAKKREGAGEATENKEPVGRWDSESVGQWDSGTVGGVLRSNSPSGIFAFSSHPLNTVAPSYCPRITTIVPAILSCHPRFSGSVRMERKPQSSGQVKMPAPMNSIGCGAMPADMKNISGIIGGR